MMEMPPLPEKQEIHTAAGMGYVRPSRPRWNNDDMLRYGELCARMAREEAAKVCERLAEEGHGNWKHATPLDCAAAIRSES